MEREGWCVCVCVCVRERERESESERERERGREGGGMRQGPGRTPDDPSRYPSQYPSRPLEAGEIWRPAAAATAAAAASESSGGGGDDGHTARLHILFKCPKYFSSI